MDIDKAFQELIEKEELNIEAAFVEEFGLDERKMTDGEKEEREEIVKKLKPKLQSFKDRYGDDAKKVMYATATKQAMEEVEIDEMPNRANMEKINTLIKKYSGKFKWRDEVLYVEKGIEKDVTSLIKKGGLTATVKVSSNPMKEEVEIDEKKSATGYELYHKTFSDAMQHAYAHAKSKGFIVDPKEIDDKVATGPKKPSSGKTNRYSLKAGRKKVEIQVANLDNKRYELNMYIEGVILESTKEYAKSLEKIARDRQISILSKSDKTTLLKIAALLDKERKEEVEVAEAFKPHKMYDPKTGKEYDADTVEDHLKYKKMGYSHEKLQVESLEKEGAAEFMAAASAAKKEGKKKFKFGGKEYPVTIKVDIPLATEEIANSVGGGGIAGLDIGLTAKKKKEDTDKAKALRKQMVGEEVQRTTFAGKDVFIVDSETFYNCRLGKKKYSRYEKYVGTGKVGQTIREYGLKYPRRPIILQNGESGPMLYLKYGRS